jgi:hypothetical protein
LKNVGAAVVVGAGSAEGAGSTETEVGLGSEVAGGETVTVSLTVTTGAGEPEPQPLSNVGKIRIPAAHSALRRIVEPPVLARAALQRVKTSP